VKRSAQFELELKKESEIWLYSYADLITNLLAFFLMLLSISQSNSEVAKRIQSSLSKLVGKSVGGAAVFSDQEVSDSLAALIEGQKMGQFVTIEKKKDGISLTLSGGIFFDTSSVVLSQEAKNLLDRLAPIFIKAQAGHRIDVEGHADARRVIGSDVFPSNWELSAARAGSVVRYLISRGLKAGSMRAIGYADTRPVSRALSPNRRVVIRFQDEETDR